MLNEIDVQYLVFDKKKNRKSAIKWSTLQFYGMIILVKTKPLCRGMAWLPLQKSYDQILLLLGDHMQHKKIEKMCLFNTLFYHF